MRLTHRPFALILRGMMKRAFINLPAVLALAVTVWAGQNRDAPAEPARDYWPTQSWQSRHPEDLGFDADKLRAAEDYIRRKDTDAFLVIRHGYIAAEHYYDDFGKNDLHNSYSVAKSFTGAAVGAAVRQGLLGGPEQSLCEFFPPDPARPDAAMYGMITLEHLLTMTSGIDYENVIHYPEMIRTKNWAAYVRSRPVIHPPGTVWKYKADPTLLSAVVGNAAGKSMAEFAREHIFEPIGITDLRWDGDPCGVTSGNGDIHTTARHYARLGFLYLNAGRWDGEQILPPGWVEASTRPCREEKRIRCDCWSKEPVRIPPDGVIEYGYLWWCRKLPGVPDDAYYAFGGFGQFILVVPGLDLVVVRLGYDREHSDLTILPDMARLVVEAVTE